jgi:hypothetical protein
MVGSCDAGLGCICKGGTVASAKAEEAPGVVFVSRKPSVLLVVSFVVVAVRSLPSVYLTNMLLLVPSTNNFIPFFSANFLARAMTFGW